MSKYAAKIDLITNILTIIVAILLIGLFVQRYVFPFVSGTGSISPTIGKTILVDNLDTSKSSKNVLIVMMKGCRYCEASMGFYKTLMQENQGTAIKFVAVFPPGTEDVNGYLGKYGITGLDVKYSELSAVNVDGTPTIIVIDQNGKVTRWWMGQLSIEREKEVMDFLGA
jgi:thioredoxin-related protein